MARATKMCHTCKQTFRAEEIVSYASPKSNTFYNYCPKCLEEKQAKDRFVAKVCGIFGLKAPGPRIWTERKRLIDTYGYTDDTIVDCLDYIYNVEHKKKLSESLCLVNPPMVEKMKKYKSKEEYNAQKLIDAMKTKIQTYVVPIRENDEKKNAINLDDWLED